jgi:hypothetical protein
MLGDVEGLRVAQGAEYDAKLASIDLLKEDRRVTETDGGLLQYHLTRPITVGPLKIETLTFKAPTVGHIRSASPRVGEEWAAYMIKQLCAELPDDAALNMIDAQEWDDIVEVVSFPFNHPPCRSGGANGRERPATSGGAS